MNKLKKFGVAGKTYLEAETAKGDTYTTNDGGFPSTNLGCSDNPFIEELNTARYILDFGCGVGRNLAWIMQNTDATYIGLDPNNSMTKFFWDVQEEQGYNIEDCIGTAYDVINQRKGKMVNGTFVKETL